MTRTRRRIVVALYCLIAIPCGVMISLSASAQVTAAEAQARFSAIVRQREAALNEAAVLAASLELSQKRVAELEKQCGEKCAPPAPKKK